MAFFAVTAYVPDYCSYVSMCFNYSFNEIYHSRHIGHIEFHIGVLYSLLLPDAIGRDRSFFLLFLPHPPIAGR